MTKLPQKASKKLKQGLRRPMEDLVGGQTPADRLPHKHWHRLPGQPLAFTGRRSAWAMSVDGITLSDGDGQGERAPTRLTCIG
jgi:hypothetical protein